MPLVSHSVGVWPYPFSAKSMSENFESLAHSANRSGRREPLTEHLAAVAERASGYATIFGAGEEARFAGLLHDLGKYGDLFQRRLTSESAVSEFRPVIQSKDPQ